MILNEYLDFLYVRMIELNVEVRDNNGTKLNR